MIRCYRAEPLEQRQSFRSEFRFASAVALLSLCLTTLAAPPPPADSSEPTVTRKEAELLQQVTAVSATNINQAVDRLAAMDLAEASPALDFALGSLHFRAEQLDAAAAAYENAIAKLPVFKRALMNLGRVYLLQEKTGRAITVFQELVKLGRADTDALLLLGHALLLQEHPVSAENAYRQALLLSPEHPDAMLGLAKCLLLQQRYHEGAYLIQERLSREPEQKELWSLMASALLALGKTDAALTALESARRLGVVDTAMLATLGDLYLSAGQPDDAAAAYEQAFTDEHTDADRLLRAAEAFLLAGELDHSERLLERVEASTGALSPEPGRIRLRLKGDLARLRGNTKEALEIYARLLAQDPLNGDVLIVMGDLHHATEALEDAVMVYERAARVAGYEARALVRQAQVEVERDRYATAVQLLEAAQAFEDQPNVARYLEQVRRLVR